MRRVAGRDRRRVAPIGCACIAMLGAIVGALLAGWTVQLDSLTSRGAQGGLDATEVCRWACSPLAELALARSALEQARVAGSPTLAVGAGAHLAAAEAMRPGWSPIALERVYREQFRSADTARMRTALAGSYRAQRFSSEAAPWRTALVARFWWRTDPALARAALSEAVWYGALDGAKREVMRRAVAGTPLEVALILDAPAPEPDRTRAPGAN